MTASQISILMIFPDGDRKDTETKMQKERQMTHCQEATGSEVSFLFFWLETFLESEREPESQESLFTSQVQPSLVHVERQRSALGGPSACSGVYSLSQPLPCSGTNKSFLQLLGVQSPSRSDPPRPAQLTPLPPVPEVFFALARKQRVPHCPVLPLVSACAIPSS